MKVVGVDSETTIKFDASPFTQENVNGLVCYGVADEDGTCAYPFTEPGPIQEVVDSGALLAFANGKFDINWFSVKGVNFTNARIWDVLIAHYIIHHQQHKFPSLNDVLDWAGIPSKLDVVATQYWEKGIDTWDVPTDILYEYQKDDAHKTRLVALKQLEVMTPAQITLCKLCSYDSVVLSEMECNGLTYNSTVCEERAQLLEEKIAAIVDKLSSYYPGIPINFNSGPQLSAFLYGGTIVEEYKERIGVFKTGAKAGQPKYANRIREHHLPRMYTPIKGTEMLKEGVYSTSEDVLKQLKGASGLVEDLLALAKMDKLLGTYYKGFPKQNRLSQWEENKIHGKYNQTLTFTGRLSSSKP